MVSFNTTKKPSMFPAYSPSDKIGMGGGAFDPASLFDGENGDVFYFNDPQYLWQNSAGTVPVATPGDPVSRVDGALGSIVTTGAGFIWDGSGVRHNGVSGFSSIIETSTSLSRTPFSSFLSISSGSSSGGEFRYGVHSGFTRVAGVDVDGSSANQLKTYFGGNIERQTAVTLNNNIHTLGITTTGSPSFVTNSYFNAVSAGELGQSSSSSASDAGIKVGTEAGDTVATFGLMIQRTLTPEEITELDTFVRSL